MREIAATEVTATVARLFREANLYLPPDVKEALKRARERESFPRAREILSRLLENALIAEKEGLPICQDTGIAVVFLEVGQEVRVVGKLEEAVHEGVREGFRQGYLRASVVRHPLDRVNTGDSTPAVIHTRLVPGDRLKITVMPKGAGSENMGMVKVLRPADGREGVKRLVLETVQRAGPNACPPLVVGVGIGGTVEKAALLAKEAVLRPVGSRHPHPLEAELEEELLEAINCLGIGPLGLGGDTTALAVHVATYPCHIASLPVAVNLSCHATRHRTAVL
ncbi:fumarate hydratase [Ammonifex thiophilus]|uniref:Fumarate hydratase n=1 Tax=Ammonifex thiophilus TaxID=444093 RepID=A0A3D8P854_9THEO|nr:fumarate hydratase [Ammonifex thiophilus]RDV84818.1 fumarate hydratase [Ammonifex thiophilus]